jgi:integrase
VFAFGTPLPNNSTRPITPFKTAWIKVRKEAGVKGRWHNNRHTLVTELAQSGAGDEVIMSIAGHVSRAMLSRYSHVRMEAKRHALDDIVAPDCGRRKAEGGRGAAGTGCGALE